MSSLKPITNKPLLFTLLCGISVLGVAAVYASLYSSAPVLLKSVFVFYAPAWMLTNACFGGPTAAPQWSYLPSMVVAVVGQNAALIMILGWLRARTKK